MGLFPMLTSLARLQRALPRLFWMGLFFSVGSANALEHVRLQLKWQHQFQFAGYYAALERGYYREAGLDVAILPAKPEVSASDKVLAGEAEFGVGTTELLLRREQGDPVVVLAVIFQHSPLALIALKGGEHQTLHDLVGQQVMIEPDSAELIALLRREKIEDTHITLLPHTYSIAHLLDRKVAAMSVYTTDEPFELKRLQQPYVVYSPRQAGIDFYGDNLFTTEQQIRQHPERVRAFRQASLKGWAYAMSHPDEMAELIHAKYKSPHDLAHLKWEAAQMADLMYPKIIDVGHMHPGRWRHIAHVYAELGMLKPDFPLNGFLYDPNPPPPDLTWLFVSLGALLLFSLAVGGNALFVFRTNRTLREAQAKTRSLLEDQHQFVRMMSHEVRGPLASIDAASHLLELRCQENDGLKAPLRRVRRGVRRLIAFVDNCMADDRLNNLSEQGLKSDDKNIYLEDFLSALITHCADDAAEHHLRLETSAPLGHYQGDSTLLRIMLSNLLSNAIKYSPVGSTIVLSAWRTADARLHLRVVDTGQGIAPQDLEHIGRRYFRGSHRGKVSGSGIGLFLAVQIARRHGGHLQIISEQDKGTTVTITLPSQPQEHQETPAKKGRP